MTLKKESNELEADNKDQGSTKQNENPDKLPYSIIAAYDGLFLDKNDMKLIYSELKNLKVNINRNNMDIIKSILISKLNLELPTTRKYQLEHLTIPYTDDQIPSSQKEDETKRNLIILHYYLDILCYGYSIHLTKWQCSSWFNVFKITHDKFIEYVKQEKDSSCYRSQCLEIFKKEIFYYCNPRTVTLYLKENENSKKRNENEDESNLNDDNLEEILLSNRFIKPGIFDSILPPPPEDLKESNNGLSSSSLNKSNTSNLSKSNNQLLNCNNNSINNKEETNIIGKSISKLSMNSLSQSRNTVNNTEDICDSYNSICTSSSNDNYDDSGDDDDDDENAKNKDLYIFEYSIPRTFNSLQIECLTRFFLKTYVQHINIIAYVFSKPQENIYIENKKTVVPPVTFEKLSHGVIAEEWPDWVQEQERILIKKKEEEEAAIEMEKKKKEEELLKEKERLEEELAKQKLKETQEAIINSLTTMLYQPFSKNISELPIIPLIKTEEEDKNEDSSNEVHKNELDDDNNLENENNNNKNEDKDENEFKNKKYNISNTNFRNSFLELWKRQVLDREQQQQELVEQLNIELQKKNDVFAFDISEESLSRLENSRHELINKIKEITGEDENIKLRYVYDPEQVENIIQNSELLKEQYFTQLQKHIEEIITTNMQHISERINIVNAELEKLRNDNNDKNNASNKKGENKKEDKNAANNKKTPNKNEDTKTKNKTKAKKK